MVEKQIVIPGGQRIGRNYKMGINEGLERAANWHDARRMDLLMSDDSGPEDWAEAQRHYHNAAAIRELKEK